MKYEVPDPLHHVLMALDMVYSMNKELLSELWDDYDVAKENRRKSYTLEQTINHLSKVHWALCSFYPCPIEEFNLTGTPEGETVVFLPKESEFDTVWHAWVPRMDDYWYLAMQHTSPDEQVTSYVINVPVETDNIESDFLRYIESARSYAEFLMITHAEQTDNNFR